MNNRLEELNIKLTQNKDIKVLLNQIIDDIHKNNKNKQEAINIMEEIKTKLLEIASKKDDINSEQN